MSELLRCFWVDSALALPRACGADARYFVVTPAIGIGGLCERHQRNARALGMAVTAIPYVVSGA